MLDKKSLQKLRATPLYGRNKVEHAMKLAGLTQVVLGERTGLGQQRISEIVRGRYLKSGLALDQARAIADVLGVSIDDIFPAERSLAS